MTGEVIEAAKRVYQMLEDDESRELFKNRLLYLATGERRYIHHMVEYRYPLHYREFASFCRKAEKIILYGAGDYCYSALEACREYAETKPFCICDGNPENWGKQGPGGYLIISPDQLVKDHKDASIVISTVRCRNEIREALLRSFPQERVFTLGLDLSNLSIADQYFDKDIIHFEEEGEYFVDGGAYDLMTSVILSQKARVNKVYAFEADSLNKDKIMETMQKHPALPVDLFMKGLWDKTENLCFDSGDEMESKISEGENTGNSVIEAVPLDETITDKVTFIKLDIEGAELKALEGAKETIKRYRPKLAICIYHKPEDMIDIPMYIHELVPEYKLYIRHYADFQYDTVLYAVI